MFIQPYALDELRFAYCYRIYLRWRTHRAKPLSVLASLNQPILDEIGSRFGIHILEANASDTDVLLLASLRPEETVSACASKLKGQISKWMRERLGLATPVNLVSKGYFACTAGKSTAEAVDGYLESQSEHHRYHERARPPVFVRSYDLSLADLDRLNSNHAATHLQHHIVLATTRRKGVFGQRSGETVAGRWQELLRQRQAGLVKASFLPDHVHLAVRVHPAVSPAALIAELMNAAQALMWDAFADDVVRAAVERLWQPSAYLGSFGDLESPKLAAYVQQFERDSRRE
jgi:REP element-mobilizing transposase RayT